MAHHIKKSKNLQGTVKSIYYQGEHKWTTKFEDRKVYVTEADATEALYEYGGTIIAE